MGYVEYTADFLTGAAFGAALRASGVYSPAVIISQLNSTNWHMVEMFLTASGTSTILVGLNRQMKGRLSIKPRECSSVGLFSPYDGNVIGSLLLGAGMALSGSCPGAVFAQVGAGVVSGLYTLAGGVVGGVIWSGILQPIIRTRTTKPQQMPADKSETQTQPMKLAIYEQLGISREAAATGVVAAFAASVAAVEVLAPPLPETRGLVTPIQGGLLVAGSQLVSIFSRTKLLGTSTSFEEVGQYISSTLGLGTSKPGSYGATILTAGMILGSFMVSSMAPENSLSLITSDTVIQPTRAIVGGVLLAVGSRMGGGCTSGHGLSGVALLSISSFVSVAAMFGGGMAIATIFGL